MKYIQINLGRENDDFGYMVAVEDDKAEALKQALVELHEQTTSWSEWDKDWDKAAKAEDELIFETVKKYGGTIIEPLEVIV